MGGGKQPAPMAGQALNNEMFVKVQEARKARMGRLSAQNDELFQTLLNSGQKPYRSSYEPEALMSSMSDQQTTKPNNFAPLEAFGPLSMFDQTRLG
jgi:hypothetical protein